MVRESRPISARDASAAVAAAGALAGRRVEALADRAHGAILQLGRERVARRPAARPTGAVILRAPRSRRLWAVRAGPSSPGPRRAALPPVLRAGPGRDASRGRRRPRLPPDATARRSARASSPRGAGPRWQPRATAGGPASAAGAAGPSPRRGRPRPSGRRARADPRRRLGCARARGRSSSGGAAIRVAGTRASRSRSIPRCSSRFGSTGAIAEPLAPAGRQRRCRGPVWTVSAHGLVSSPSGRVAGRAEWRWSAGPGRASWIGAVIGRAGEGFGGLSGLAAPGELGGPAVGPTSPGLAPGGRLVDRHPAGGLRGPGGLHLLDGGQHGAALLAPGDRPGGHAPVEVEDPAGQRHALVAHLAAVVGEGAGVDAPSGVRSARSTQPFARASSSRPPISTCRSASARPRPRSCRGPSGRRARRRGRRCSCARRRPSGRGPSSAPRAPRSRRRGSPRARTASASARWWRRRRTPAACRAGVRHRARTDGAAMAHPRTSGARSHRSARARPTARAAGGAGAGGGPVQAGGRCRRGAGAGGGPVQAGGRCRRRRCARSGHGPSAAVQPREPSRGRPSARGAPPASRPQASGRGQAVAARARASGRSPARRRGTAGRTAGRAPGAGPPRRPRSGTASAAAAPGAGRRPSPPRPSPRSSTRPRPATAPRPGPARARSSPPIPRTTSTPPSRRGNARRLRFAQGGQFCSALIDVSMRMIMYLFTVQLHYRYAGRCSSRKAPPTLFADTAAQRVYQYVIAFAYDCMSQRA